LFCNGSISLLRPPSKGKRDVHGASVPDLGKLYNSLIRGGKLAHKSVKNGNIHKKQRQYLSEILRLHYEKGYGGVRISRILPIEHATVDGLAIFASKTDKAMR
jgi:hypothetical protein